MEVGARRREGKKRNDGNRKGGGEMMAQQERDKGKRKTSKKQDDGEVFDKGKKKGVRGEKGSATGGLGDKNGGRRQQAEGACAIKELAKEKQKNKAVCTTPVWIRCGCTANSLIYNHKYSPLRAQKSITRVWETWLES